MQLLWYDGRSCLAIRLKDKSGWGRNADVGKVGVGSPVIPIGVLTLSHRLQTRDFTPFLTQPTCTWYLCRKARSRVVWFVCAALCFLGV